MRGRLQRGGVYVEDPYLTTSMENGAPIQLAVTRDALETLLRKLVRETRPNVEFRTGTVTALNATTLGQQVEKATIRLQDGTEAEEAGDVFIGTFY